MRTNTKTYSIYSYLLSKLIVGSLLILMASCNPVSQTNIQELFSPGIYASLENSTLEVSASTVKSGESVIVTLKLRDNNNNTYLTVKDIIEFFSEGGTGTGTFGGVKNLGDGRYTVNYTGVSAGTPNKIYAKINNKRIISSSPTIQVLPGAFSLSHSILALSSNTVTSGSSVTATLQVKDSDNNQLSTGGLAVSFVASSGTSTVSIGSVIDNLDGTYSATITGVIAGTATTVTAKIAGLNLTSASPQITVSHGAITQLGFATMPSLTGNTDSNLSVQPAVAALDANGNRVLSYSGSITLTAYSDTTCTTLVAGALSATSNPVTASSGVANFNQVKILKTSVRSIKASNGALSVCSSALTINPGAIQSLVFTTQPSPLNPTTDQTLTTQPVVTAYDANSNIVTTNSSSSVDLIAYDGNACSGSSVTGGLAGTTPLTLNSGVASFTDIKVIKTTVKSIKASIGGVSTCSSNLSVTPGSIASITFTTQPSPLTPNTDSAFSTQPVVTAYDANSNVLTNNSSTAVDLTAYDGNSCTGSVVTGSLSGTTSVNLSSGVATYTNIKVIKTSIKSLKATAGSVTVCSNNLVVSPGSIQSLSFSTQPSPLSTNTDSGFTTQPVITAFDANANVVTNNSSSSIALTAYDANSCGGSIVASGLSGTTSVVLSSGVANFVGIKVVKTSVKSLKATTGGITVCSNNLSIAPGAILSIAFTTQPAPLSTNADTAFTTQPVITAYDANSNIVSTDSSSSLSLAAYNGASCSGATVAGALSGTASVTLNQGVATFTNIKVIKTNAVSILGTLGSKTVCSSNFTISAGSPTQISIVSGDSQTAFLGQALTLPFTVNVKDANNNLVSGATINWSASSGTLSGGSSTTTDASGNTSSTLTLATNSTAAGVKTTTATINGTSTLVTFSATANVSAPTGVAGTNGAASTNLTWTATTGATSYKIYRSTTSGSGYSLVNTSATNSYSDSGLTNGTTYYYVVSAVNNSIESAQSSQISVTPVVSPGAPTNPSATFASQQTVLSWSAPATGTAPFTYKIYRSTSISTGFTNIATTTAGVTTYTDTGLTNGTTYYYAITALNGSVSGESAYSDKVSITPDYIPTLQYDFTTGSSFQPHNLLVRSATFSSSSWSKGNATIQSNATLAPDGTFTASRLIDNSTSAEHMISQARNSTNETGTFSVYLKAAEYDRAQIQLSNMSTEAKSLKVNLANCTFISGSSAGADYTNPKYSAWNVGNGWCRVVITATKGSVNNINSVTIAPVNSANTSVFAGTGSSGIYLWGAQFELNPGVSQYVPTTTVASAGFTSSLTPIFGSTLATFTRNGSAPAATLYGSDSFIRRAPHNYMLYSSDYTNAAWTNPSSLAVVTNSGAIAPDGTATAQLVDVTTGSARITQSKNVDGYSNYTLSVYLKAVSGSGTWDLSFNCGSLGVVHKTVTINSTSWTRVDYTVFPTSAESCWVYPAYYGWSQTVTQAYMWGVQFESNRTPSAYVSTTSSALYSSARYDYNPTTLEPRGLLSEEERTNLMTYSEDIGNSAWTKNNCTAQTNIVSVTAPDGSSQADKLVEGASGLGSVNQFTQQPFAVTAGKTYTISAYVKPAEISTVTIRFGTLALFGTETWALFSLSGNGSLTSKGSVAALNPTITPLPNSWYRVTVSATATSSGTSGVGIWLRAYDSHVGDGTSGIYVWGAQAEEGSFASSYIPTTTTSLTRYSDVMQVLAGSWINPTTGTMLTDQTPSFAVGDSSTGRFPGIISPDGTTYVALREYRNSNTIKGMFRNGSDYSTAGTTYTNNTNYRGAVAYGSGNSTFAAFGSTQQASSMPSIDLTNSYWQLGGFGTGGYSGHVKKGFYYNSRIPDADLLRLTQ